ncbi:MAG: AIR synthase related protein [Candidatus Dormibacteraeota bacterium]|nr:AIR synthase related protein [Candidatus Dormibacteraeota bacterium]
MDELSFLERLRPHLAARSGKLVIGAGDDDAAAWREPDGSYTIATSDTSIEGVHFDLGRQDPTDVGWRALCFALGDLAAKGARPTYCMVALSLPVSWTAEIAAGLYSGLAELAREVGLKLVGGDTTRAPHDASLTLMLLGSTWVEPKARASVRAGWSVGVTGPLGAASLGWTRPRPRLQFGARLAAAGLCSGDISDGLVRELDKFAAAAGVGATVRLNDVPLAGGSKAEAAIVNGEEVELICCGPAPLPAGVQVVGELTSGGGVVVLDAVGAAVQLPGRGYDHLSG